MKKLSVVVNLLSKQLHLQALWFLTNDKYMSDRESSSFCFRNTKFIPKNLFGIAWWRENQIKCHFKAPAIFSFRVPINMFAKTQGFLGEIILIPTPAWYLTSLTLILWTILKNFASKYLKSYLDIWYLVGGVCFILLAAPNKVLWVNSQLSHLGVDPASVRNHVVLGPSHISCVNLALDLSL